MSQQNSELKSIELISFNLCPFVQRSVITLLQKGIDFKITYIDLTNKPDWFLAISPLGKVPVVRYGDDVLFESAIINEFLDEITPPSLMPTEPLAKAQDRAWIEYASQILMDQYRVFLASNQADLTQHRETLDLKLQRLETIISDDNFFHSSGFSLVDAALAPLFTRLDVVQQRFNHDLLAEHPKLSALSERLLALDSVKKSVINDFADVFVRYFSERNSSLMA